MPRTLKQRERKRAELQEQFKDAPYLAVGDLINLLRTYPMHLPVTGFNVHEETTYVRAGSVRLYAGQDRTWGINQDHVDIMGSLDARE